MSGPGTFAAQVVWWARSSTQSAGGPISPMEQSGAIASAEQSEPVSLTASASLRNKPNKQTNKLDDDGSGARLWWNTQAKRGFQHLNRGFVMQQKKQWHTYFLPEFNWTGKRVLDYGIGGGYLG